MSKIIFVRLSVRQVIDTVEKALLEGSLTGEKTAGYVLPCGDKSCEVAVFEKHFYRAGNRLTLTVTADDFDGSTRVYLTGGGGGEGMFRFDWGAGASFEDAAVNALAPYAHR